MVVKRIAPISAFKVGFVVHAFLGLLAGLACAWLTHAGIAHCPISRMLFHEAFVALPLIVCPLFSGLMGSIVTVLGALFYNLASEFVGGLELEIR